MAWTTPAAWTDNVAVTKADLDAQLYSNMRYLKGLDGPIYLQDVLELAESAAPSTPASGRGRLYIDSNGIPSGLDDGGIAYQMTRNVPGTWTPALLGSGTAGTFTYDTTNTKAQYTRSADRVHFNGRVIITATAVAPTGSISITGLSIAAGANSNNGNILGGANITITGINLAAGYTQVEGVIFGTATSIALYETGDNVARAAVQGGELATTWDFWFWGSYKID